MLHGRGNVPLPWMNNTITESSKQVTEVYANLKFNACDHIILKGYEKKKTKTRRMLISEQKKKYYKDKITSSSNIT